MALEVLDTLRTLGVTVTAIPPDRLRLEPASKVPKDLLARILESKREILEALRNRPVTGKPVECRYNWQPGYRGLRLHCVAHHHAAGTGTVSKSNQDYKPTLVDPDLFLFTMRCRRVT
jgi:hypothetical protein